MIRTMLIITGLAILGYFLYATYMGDDKKKGKNDSVKESGDAVRLNRIEMGKQGGVKRVDYDVDQDKTQDLLDVDPDQLDIDPDKLKRNTG